MTSKLWHPNSNTEIETPKFYPWIIVEGLELGVKL